MFGPGGMPRSKHQQALDEMLTSSPDVGGPLPGGRTSTMASLGGGGGSGGGNRRRSSNASSKNFFSGWGRKKNSGNFEDDGYMGDELIDDMHYAQPSPGPQSAGSSGDVSMDQLKSLRDRDRYPTMSSTSGGGKNDRSMSITSMSSGLDTTPIIPTFRGDQNNPQNSQYRKNLTNARKQAMMASGGPPPNGYPPPPNGYIPGPGGPLPPPGPPNGFGPPRRGPFRPPSRGGPPPDSRLQSMTEHPDEMKMMPPSSPRAMSMTTNRTLDPSRSPPLGRFSGPVPRRISAPPPMVSKGTMTDPVPEPPLPAPALQDEQDESHSTSSSRRSMTSDNNNVTMANGLMTPESQATKTTAESSASSSNSISTLNKELANMNKNLLDEISVVTNELADAVRRELGLEPKENDLEEHDHTAQHLVRLQTQLDLERRKRLLAESHVADGPDGLKSLHHTYDNVDLERQLAEKERAMENEKTENLQLRENMESLTQKFEALQDETNQLKNGILPELKSHVEDLEVLTATGNPIELVKQVDELKVENVKLQKLVQEQSTRGPLGEKIKSVEAQRDALREAFRSLREKKDHEIRQSQERIRQLELRLDKERVVNSQMQRKFVQTSTRSASSPTTQVTAAGVASGNNNHASSSSNSTASSPADTSLTQRRGLKVPGIVPPKVLPNTDNIASSPRPNTPSPISFEISQEPAWLDYVDPSKIPSQHQRQASAPVTSDRSASSSLSLPNGRTEALPLSLGNP